MGLEANRRTAQAGVIKTDPSNVPVDTMKAITMIVGTVSFVNGAGVLAYRQTA
jgi:hypothetical protein